MAKRGRRITPQRLRRVEEASRRLIDAIERDPLLVRLPGERVLAGLLGVAVREVRMAVRGLLEAGVLASAGRAGFRVQARPAHRPTLQSIVMVESRFSFNSLRVQCMFKGADEACRRHRLAFLARWIREGHDLDEQLEAMAVETPGRHVGWLLAVLPSEALIERWGAQGRRIGLVDQVHSRIALPTAMIDPAGAIELAIEHLAGLGHARPALVARRPDPLTEPFFDARKGAFDPAWSLNVAWGVEGDDLISRVGQWIARWQAAPPGRRPTAVVAFNLRLAYVLHRMLSMEGIGTPADLSLLALGTDWATGWSDLSALSLASMGDPADLGKEAVEALVAASSDEGEEPAPVRRLSAELLRSDVTVGPPPPMPAPRPARPRVPRNQRSAKRSKRTT